MGLKLSNYPLSIYLSPMQILTVVIGIIFVLLLLSLLATTIMELLSSLFSLRGRNLTKALRNMLASSDTNEILPGYCEWLNKNDDKMKPICQSSSNNEIDLFWTDVINSVAFGPYPSYPVWDYVTRFKKPDEEACHQRCLNARLCTPYSHFN